MQGCVYNDYLEIEAGKGGEEVGTLEGQTRRVGGGVWDHSGCS